MGGYISTRYPGVRYREHPTRRLRNSQADRYYTIRYRVDGRRCEEAVGWASEGWTPERAHNILAEIRRNIKTGIQPQSLAAMRSQASDQVRQQGEDHAEAELEAMTLGDFLLHHYLPVARRTKRSWRSDEGRIRNHILPTLGSVPLRSLRRVDVQAMLDRKLDQGLSPASVEQIAAMVRRAYNIAGDTTINGQPLFGGQNPAIGLRLAKIINARERYLTPDETGRLLAAARNLPTMDTHDAIILALYAGLRMGEIRRLRWIDIDFETAILTVREEERRKPGGKVPMAAVIVRTLEQRRDRQGDPRPTDHVFPAKDNGGPRSRFDKLYIKIVDQVGLNEGIDPQHRQHKAVFHTLRHTFASWLAIQGTDIYRIQRLMRHRTIAMTMRYAHLLPDATRDAVDHLPSP